MHLNFSPRIYAPPDYIRSPLFILISPSSRRSLLLQYPLRIPTLNHNIYVCIDHHLFLPPSISHPFHRQASHHPFRTHIPKCTCIYFSLFRHLSLPLSLLIKSSASGRLFANISISTFDCCFLLVFFHLAVCRKHFLGNDV